MSASEEVFRLACVTWESVAVEAISKGIIARAELRARAISAPKDSPSTLISVLKFPAGTTHDGSEFFTPLNFLGDRPIHCALVDFEITLYIVDNDAKQPSLRMTADDTRLTWDNTSSPYMQSVTVCGDAGPREATLVYAKECCGLAKK